MDALDRVLDLPMRRALPDLSLGVGLVPAYGTRSCWVWTCLLAGIDNASKNGDRNSLIWRLTSYGLTLEDYLRDQERRLRAAHPAVIPVRLHLRAPGKVKGVLVPGLLGIPRADMPRQERVDYAREVMASILARPRLQGHVGSITTTRRPDGPRKVLMRTDPVTGRLVSGRRSPLPAPQPNGDAPAQVA